jgi:hypothetical protein
MAGARECTLIIPVFPRCKLNLWLLKLGVSCATCVPNAQDLNASVPVIIEDFDRVVGSDKVDGSVCSSYKLAVVCQLSRVDHCKIDVCAQNHSKKDNGTKFYLLKVI